MNEQGSIIAVYGNQNQDQVVVTTHCPGTFFLVPTLW